MRRFLSVTILLIVTISLICPAFSQDDRGKEIIKQGIVGAGVGAISASASGGKAGKGALVGAGTNILGNAILDTFMSPSQPQAASTSQYNTSLYDQGYQEGYRQGYRDGYGVGYQEGTRSK